jgi:hypothetical protein
MTETLNNDFIKKLYNKYLNEIKIIRNNMQKNYYYGRPAYDDIEAEITSLFILHFKPKHIIEFSPSTGWSTSIMLNALELNNNSSVLSSYDIEDRGCKPFIDSLNYKNVKWNFTLGDVTNEYSKWDLNNIDYLFIDSDHSEKFAHNYINNLLIPLLNNCKQNKKHIIVGIHDIFDKKGAIKPYREGKIVLDFLKTNNIKHYNVSKALNTNYSIINNYRKENGITKIIHKDANPSIWFYLQ